ncbi:MAG: glycosyltransferase involved in cell wall biosynthesis [Flavobacteriaceae bacterium]|jgi:glycosyltransferase involved in cell wall biosynthesis
MKKISIFLGGYINYTNAQNLNCRAIAEHLNKEKFDVFTLKAHFGDNTSLKINTFTCKIPFRFTRHLGFLWGISHCDIAYLPKHSDTPFWVLMLAKLLNKPIFTTIEGIETIKRLILSYNSVDKIVCRFKYFHNIYAITDRIIINNNKFITLESNPLLLGVNTSDFTRVQRNQLDSICFVGHLSKKKRVYELITLAKLYPNIEFKIIGEGPEQQSLQNKAPLNVTFFGKLKHKEMDAIFSSSDLLFLPSKSEGFPKVILEAAAAGVPSVVYDCYGASDWIDNKKNGFIVNDFNDVKSIVNELLNDSILLQNTSEGAIKLAHRFDWKNIINDWEKVIVDLYNGK